MDTAFWWSFLFSFGVSACCGVRAGLSLLGVSLLAHLGWLFLHPAFSFMADWRFIALVVLAAVLEIIIDKFRASSNILDGCGVVLRTVVALWITAALIGGDIWSVWVIGGIVLGGLTTFVVNLAKPMVRAWTTDLVPNHTFRGTLAVSIFEDIAIGLALVGVIYWPWLGLAYGILALLVGLTVLGLFVRQGGSPLHWHWNRVGGREIN